MTRLRTLAVLFRQEPELTAPEHKVGKRKIRMARGAVIPPRHAIMLAPATGFGADAALTLKWITMPMVGAN